MKLINETAECKWCGKTFDPVDSMLGTCDDITCIILEFRFNKLWNSLSRRPKLRARIMERMKELNEIINNQSSEFKGNRQKLWSGFLSDFYQHKKDLSPNTKDQTYCRWCGYEFTPKSHNSQTCDSKECASTRRRYHELKKRLKRYPIILQAFKIVDDEITIAALEGGIAIDAFWKELFKLVERAIVYVQKSKKE